MGIDQYWSKNRFFGLFDNFSLFLANPEKIFFFRFFDFFFQPKSDFFRFSTFHFCQKIGKSECQKYEKNVFGLKKKNRKIEKKIFFSGLARNRLKLSKSPKNRFLDQYWSIYNHFLAKICDGQNHQFAPKIVKN